MKRLSQAVAVLLCLFGTSVAAFATTGYTAVTASHIQDASGYLLASGRVTFFPVNNLGQPVSAIAYGGGIITQTGVVFLVVNGAITTDIHGNTPQIADTALTTPAHICYRIVVTNSTGAQIQGPGYALQQPTGTTFNLDTVVPNQPMQATIQTGPAGPAGTTLNFNGTWSSSTNYINTSSVTQSVYYGGSSYVSLVSPNLNHEPDTSPSDWTLLVSGGGGGSGLPTGTGLVKVASGVGGLATAGTDYALPNANTTGNAGTATVLASAQTACTGATPFLAGIGNGGVSSANCIRGTSNPVPPGTGGFEYLMTEQTGTTLNDVSGNGNNGAFGSGGNAPSWNGYGVAMSDGGFGYADLWIDTPVTNFGSIAFNYCTPRMGQTTGIATGGFPAQTYPVIWGTSGGTGGLWVLSNFNSMNAVEPLIWNVASTNVLASVGGYQGGCHRYIYSGGNPGAWYMDGNLMNGSMGNTPAYSAISGGHYRIGDNGGGAGLRGVFTHFIDWPSGTYLTASQAAQVDTYMLDVQINRPGYPRFPVLTNATSAQLLIAGTSIDAGYLGNHAWSNDVSTNTPYTVINYAIGGSTAIDLCTTAEQRWLQGVVPGNTTLYIDGPTNDMASGPDNSAAAAWNSIALCAAKAHNYGVRIVTSTMIDRNGLSGTDAQKNAYNVYARAHWRGVFDAFLDIAEVPALGADGASSNTSCYQSDQTHLVSSTGIGGSCATIGTTALSGYGIYAYLVSGIVNALDGSSASTPSLTSSNAYVEAYADGFLIQTPTAAATNTLVDCQGIVTPRTIVNASGTYSITVSDPTSHSFIGSNVVAPNITAQFQSVAGASSTGGCSWLRAQ